RVMEVREAVDHRHPRAAREVDDALVQEHARQDEIDPAFQVARDVARGLALAELDVARREADCGAAELDHPDLEGHAGPQAGLLEDHGERAAREERVRAPRPQIALQPRRQLEDGLDLGRLEVGDAEQIPLHAVAARARSSRASPWSTSSAVMISGGVIRSTRSAVQLM